MKIAVITPCVRGGGGVAQLSRRLFLGLHDEKHCVYLVDLGCRNSKFMYTYRNDLLHGLKAIKNADIIIYLGSIPYPSHIFAKLCSKVVILFVNGYVHFEHMAYLKHALKTLNVRRILVVILNWFLFFLGSFFVDLYVFLCHGALQHSRVDVKKSIVLHLWLTQNDLKKFDKIKSAKRPDNVIRIVSYSSYVHSPKLLKIKDLMKLAQLLNKKVKRKFEFIIVDPRGFPQKINNVCIVGALPEHEFLKLLASAHLYVDSVIDDELRYSTIEAMAMGTPVAKLTYPEYWDKLDFKYRLFVKSFNELVEAVSEYINNMEKLLPEYSKILQEYVLTKRLWTETNFLEIIENLGKRRQLKLK